MWSFVNTMGHPGRLMGPQINQKREFSLSFEKVPVVPGKNFTNPNFVNKHDATCVHCCENSFISTPIEKISHIDSSNVNSVNTNSGLINSSRSIIDTIKENQLDVVKEVEPNSEVDKSTKTKPIRMCYNIKRNKRSRKNRRRKVPGKHSKQNTNRQQRRDMMDVDVEMELASNASDISMSPKFINKTFNLTDFIIERPNKPSELLKDDESVSDEDDFTCITSINSRTTVRERKLSVAESEDSFIVFESGTDEELEFSEGESDDDIEEEDADSASPVIPQKRVRFADDSNLCEIHPMVQWSYAYQEARKGHWQEYARDRDRFQRRIANLERVLTPILDSKHREDVYQHRFN